MVKELSFVLLLDCYGDLLTEHQRNIMNLYYCEDLSLAEISIPLGISRQAVRCIIKRSENILLNYEQNLGFVQRLQNMRLCFNRINDAVQKIENEDIKNSILNEIDCVLDLL